VLKRAFIFFAVIGVIAGGLFALRQAQRDAEPEEKLTITTVAERKTIEEAIEESGFVEPEVSTEVRSEISGRIRQVFIEPGEIVQAGQTLIELDPLTLENDLVEAQRNHQADSLRLVKAKRDFERLRELRKNEYAQEQEYLDAETAYQLAQIQVEVSAARLEKAEDNLQKTVIRAPQGGTVSDLTVNEGQVIIGATSVNQGTLLMKIHDLSSLYVRLEVNELDIAKIKEGMSAEVSFDSIPDLQLEGTVSRIHPFAFNQSNVRVFQTEVTFESASPLIRPGISADIRIVTGRAENAVTVSLSAVFTDELERYVYVLEDPTLPEMEKRPVETGISNTRWVEIREGLNEGDTVSLIRPKAPGNGKTS